MYIDMRGDILKLNMKRLSFLFIMSSLYFHSGQLIEQSIDKICTEYDDASLDNDEYHDLDIYDSFLSDNELVLNYNGELTDGDYNNINAIIKLYDIDALMFVETDLKYVDFEKINCPNLRSLTVDSCCGTLDLAPLEARDTLCYLGIYQTNFKNLDKLHHLENFTLSTDNYIFTDVELDFRLNQSYEEIVESLKVGGSELKKMDIKGLPVSDVDIPLDCLSLTFDMRGEVPDTLFFDAKTLILISNDENDFYKAPKFNSTTCEEVRLFYFNTALEDIITDCNAKNIYLCHCNINNSIDEIADSSIILNDVTLNGQDDSYTTYCYDDNCVYLNDSSGEIVGVGKVNVDDNDKVFIKDYNKNIRK